MSKSRIPSSERKARRSAEVGKTPFQRYLGLSLSGGKSDKSCLAVLEIYPDQKRIFLSRLHEKIKTEETISADGKILRMIEELLPDSRAIAFDAPLNLPQCLDCPIACKGYETCPDPQVKWMRKIDQAAQAKKRPKKSFTPYTQRPIDLYLAQVEDENLEVQHTMGANLAPLAARAMYLKKRIPLEAIEVFPRLAVWRIGLELKVSKSQLRVYRNSIGGEEARRVFLHALAEKAGLFIYQQDLKALCENPHAFDAFISAWVAFLREQEKTEAPPADFPKGAAWVEFPKAKSLPF